MSLRIDEGLIAGILRGDKRAIGRAISVVEAGRGSGREPAEALLDALFAHTGRAFRLGITGPPGAGKSTLVTALTKQYRKRGLSVGIVAVDPTSPYSGGALLGDRIRMLDLALEPGVFIRSMAARGALGGLSRAAQGAADVLDASGKDIVIVETVGVGQSELEIAAMADATVVVLVPESGDAVQAMKAGLMEIADLFVINKSDRPGAEQAAAAVGLILSFRVTHDPAQWIAPVLQCVASEDGGIVELDAAIDAYRAHQIATGAVTGKRAHQARERVRQIIEAYRHDGFWSAAKRAQLGAGVAAVLARQTSPYTLARRLMGD